MCLRVELSDSRSSMDRSNGSLIFTQENSGLVMSPQYRYGSVEEFIEYIQNRFKVLYPQSDVYPVIVKEPVYWLYVCSSWYKLDFCVRVANPWYFTLFQYTRIEIWWSQISIQIAAHLSSDFHSSCFTMSIPTVSLSSMWTIWRGWISCICNCGFLN